MTMCKGAQADGMWSTFCLSYINERTLNWCNGK